MRSRVEEELVKMDFPVWVVGAPRAWEEVILRCRPGWRSHDEGVVSAEGEVAVAGFGECDGGGGGAAVSDVGVEGAVGGVVDGEVGGAGAAVGDEAGGGVDGAGEEAVAIELEGGIVVDGDGDVEEGVVDAEEDGAAVDGEGSR